MQADGVMDLFVMQVSVYAGGWVMDLTVMQVSVYAGRWVMDLTVMQVSVCAGRWGYGYICNAGVCMCRWMGLCINV